MTSDKDMGFSIKQLSAGYPEHLVLNSISTDIPKGKLTAVIGPNGCGKSTLLKCLSQLVTIKSGAIFLDGNPLERLNRRLLAKQLTYLPQQPLAPRGIHVFDLVARGRTPHQSLFQQWSDADQNAVETALAQVNLQAIPHAFVDELSGGQRQRAWIAMTLAQQTDTILLDEPTASLDPKHQLEVFKLLKKQCDEQGKTIVVVVHDLNMALQFSDHVLALKQGELVKAGATKHTLTPPVIQQTFDLNCEITHSKDGEISAIIPIS
ncbi:ABC transporter ATP-binding protein [Leucothrix sargassi]|nr:ABC transporter ATP-binding protein [Leucothrix sargassi]